MIGVHSSLGDVPVVKRAVGLWVSMEFLNDDENTSWYKGTVISYCRRGILFCSMAVGWKK